MAENAVNQKALSASGHALVRWFNLWFLWAFRFRRWCLQWIRRLRNLCTSHQLGACSERSRTRLRPLGSASLLCISTIALLLRAIVVSNLNIMNHP